MSEPENPKKKSRKIFRFFFFETFLVSEIGFSSFSADLGGARLFLTSKSDSWRYFASDGQIFMSVGPKIIEMRPILNFGKFWSKTREKSTRHFWANFADRPGICANLITICKNPGTIGLIRQKNDIRHFWMCWSWKTFGLETKKSKNVE